MGDFIKLIVFRLFVVWMSFNAMIFLFKVNGLDNPGNLAWEWILKYFWEFDLLLFKLIILLLAIAALSGVAVLGYHVIPGLKANDQEENIQTKIIEKQLSEKILVKTEPVFHEIKPTPAPQKIIELPKPEPEVKPETAGDIRRRVIENLSRRL